MALQVATLTDFEELHSNLKDEILENRKMISSMPVPKQSRLVGKSKLCEILDSKPSTVDNWRREGLIKTYYVKTEGKKRGRPMFDPEEAIEQLKQSAA